MLSLPLEDIFLGGLGGGGGRKSISTGLFIFHLSMLIDCVLCPVWSQPGQHCTCRLWCNDWSGRYLSTRGSFPAPDQVRTIMYSVADPCTDTLAGLYYGLRGGEGQEEKKPLFLSVVNAGGLVPQEY